MQPGIEFNSVILLIQNSTLVPVPIAKSAACRVTMDAREPRGRIIYSQLWKPKPGEALTHEHL